MTKGMALRGLLLMVLAVGIVGCDTLASFLPQEDPDSYAQKKVYAKALRVEIETDKRTLTLKGMIRNDGDRNLSDVVVVVKPMMEGEAETRVSLGPLDAKEKREIDPTYVGQLSRDTIYFVSQIWVESGTFADQP